MIDDIIFNDFRSAHAPSLLKLDNGVILLAFHGKKTNTAPQSIWLTKYEKNQWGEPREILSGQTVGHCFNPVLFQYKKSQLWIFVKTGIQPTQWLGGLIVSESDGEHWSPYLALPKGILGSTKNPVLKLNHNMTDGQILIPSSREELVRWYPVMEIYDPHKGSFKTVSFEASLSPEFRAIQPTLISRSDESIVALFRTNLKFVYSSTSRDGNNWTELQKTNFPNPNSAINSVTDKESGDTYLAMNPSSYNRRKLWIIIYQEESKYPCVLTEIAHDHFEVSYPSIIIKDKQYLLISYAINQRSIAVKEIVR